MTEPTEPTEPTEGPEAATPAGVAGPDAPGGSRAGEGLVRLDLWATGAFTAAAVAGALSSGPPRLLAAGISLVLFAAGIVLFLWGFALAVDRSRTEAIGVGGLFFLAGSAPRPVQVRLLGALVVQVVVSVGASLAQPFTAVAFTTLAPMFGLGACGLWAARHGTFPPRDDAGPATGAAGGGSDGEPQVEPPGEAPG